MRSEGRLMKWKPTLQSRSPMAIMGMEPRRIRRLPIRSISSRATQVIRKLVTAITRDVKVGLLKPRMVKIVAEKYMREF